jgi:hypothetical protein
MEENDFDLDDVPAIRMRELTKKKWNSVPGLHWSMFLKKSRAR